MWRSPLIYLYYTKITNIFQTTKNTFKVQCFPKTTCYYSFPYVNIEIDYYKYNNINKGKIIEYSDKYSIAIHDELPNIFISFYESLEDKTLQYIKDKHNNIHIINSSLLEVSQHNPKMINELVLDLINQQQFIKEIYIKKKNLEDIYLHKIGGFDK